MYVCMYKDGNMYRSRYRYRYRYRHVDFMIYCTSIAYQYTDGTSYPYRSRKTSAVQKTNRVCCPGRAHKCCTVG